MPPKNWLIAPSLEQLRAQLNALAPKRSTASDGGIGDAAHATRASDHNPWWVVGDQPYVTARDFTHDPAGGLDCRWLAERLEASRDQRIKYVIWNRQIMAGAAGPSPWVWRPYAGSNPHNKHLHLSVVPDARSLTRVPWYLETKVVGSGPLPAVGTEADVSPELERMIREIHHELTVRLPNRRGPNGAEIPNGGADTVLGYAANADGATFRASWTLHDLLTGMDQLHDMVTGLAERLANQEARTAAREAPPVPDAGQLAAELIRQLSGGQH
jgi:hypothetical protein